MGRSPTVNLGRNEVHVFDANFGPHPLKHPFFSREIGPMIVFSPLANGRTVSQKPIQHVHFKLSHEVHS